MFSSPSPEGNLTFKCVVSGPGVFATTGCFFLNCIFVTKMCKFCRGLEWQAHLHHPWTPSVQTLLVKEGRSGRSWA